MVRRLTFLGAALAALALMAAPSALSPHTAEAHVHGITPLLQCDENPNSGATVAGEMADVIQGLIPSDVGQSPLEIGDGGFDAPVRCPSPE